MQIASTITPCLWFQTQAEEAAHFYTSIFPNTSIGQTTRYGEAGKEFHHMEAGSVMTIEFTLNGHTFIALNGGPVVTFNEAVSFMVLCEDQAELDYYWERLGAGGDERAQQCGWLKDRFGLSWQVIPREWADMVNHPDQDKAQRAMSAVMRMKKIDIAAVRSAFEGAAEA